MFLRFPPEATGPGTRSLRFTTSAHPAGTTTGCSKQISRRASMRSTHTALMERVRRRVRDKRVLGLVKAFLKAGVLAEDGSRRATITGTPQGGILSPLLANIALSVLDEHFTQKWEAFGPEWTRAKRRRAGEPVMRLVRYADDFVVMVHGTRDGRRSALGRGRSGARSDGAAPLGRENEGLPHRRRVRLLGLAPSSVGTGEAALATKRSTPTRPRSRWLRSSGRSDC